MAGMCSYNALFTVGCAIVPTLHTAHCTVHTTQYIVHSTHCTLQTAHFTLHSTLNTAHYKVHSAQCSKGAATTQVRTEAAHPSPLGIVRTLVSSTPQSIQVFNVQWPPTPYLIVFDSFKSNQQCTGSKAMNDKSKLRQIRNCDYINSDLVGEQEKWLIIQGGGIFCKALATLCCLTSAIKLPK